MYVVESADINVDVTGVGNSEYSKLLPILFQNKWNGTNYIRMKFKF